MSAIEVISPGPLTTIQDLGRPGWAHIGVPRSGAADRAALMLANRLLGNPDGVAGLETTLSGPRLRLHGQATAVLTGAPVRASVEGRELSMYEPFVLADGEVLRVGTARNGLRSYLAFAGGILAPTTLGSAATDTLTGLGPPPLASGDLLELGAPDRVGTEATPETGARPEPGADPSSLRIVRGPRDDWLTPEAMRTLLNETFTVTPESNRVGLRLSGPTLQRARHGELLSEGVLPGSIQVPPGGQPILLLADHPTTGGYPVIATLASADVGAAAQLRPGQAVSFHE